MDRTNIGNAKLDGLLTDLHMTSGQYNASLSVFLYVTSSASLIISFLQHSPEPIFERESDIQQRLLLGLRTPDEYRAQTLSTSPLPHNYHGVVGYLHDVHGLREEFQRIGSCTVLPWAC